MSLRWRVALLIAGLVAVAVSIGSIGAQVSASGELRDEIDTFLVERSAQTAQVLGRPAPLVATGQLEETRRGPFDGFTPGVIRGRFRDPRLFLDGDEPFGEVDAVTQVVTAAGDPVVLAQDQEVLAVDLGVIDEAHASGDGVFDEVDLDGVTYRRISVPLAGGATLQVARSLEEVDDALGGLRSRLWILGVTVTGIAAIAGWLLARQTSRPIEKLTVAADHVAQTQDLDAAIDVGGTGEVGRLAGSFNTMLAALRSSRHQQRQLILDASHELRTPLTSLQTNADLLESRALTPEDRGRAISAIRSEVGELTDLVSELVDLSTDSTRVEPFTPCTLSEVAATVVERARLRYQRPIELRSMASSEIHGQPSMLERAISNLIDNAAKFSPEGSPIEVSIDATTVSVRDHGPGIDDDDLDHVFDRFYRATHSRALPGSGLGLSIVQYVAEAHSGEAFARNEPDGGATVGFTVHPGGDT